MSKFDQCVLSQIICFQLRMILPSNTFKNNSSLLASVVLYRTQVFLRHHCKNYALKTLFLKVNPKQYICHTEHKIG